MNGSKLVNAVLIEADLSNSVLAGANLSGSDLTSVNLSNANLTNTNLSNSNLRNADLSNVIFSNTNLSGADLRGALVTNLNDRLVNLEGALLDQSDFQESEEPVSSGIVSLEEKEDEPNELNTFRSTSCFDALNMNEAEAFNLFYLSLNDLISRLEIASNIVEDNSDLIIGYTQEFCNMSGNEGAKLTSLYTSIGMALIQIDPSLYEKIVLLDKP